MRITTVTVIKITAGGPVGIIALNIPRLRQKWALSLPWGKGQKGSCFLNFAKKVFLLMNPCASNAASSRATSSALHGSISPIIMSLPRASLTASQGLLSDRKSTFKAYL